MIPGIRGIYPAYANLENMTVGMVNISPNRINTSNEQGNDSIVVAITLLAFPLLRLKKK
jgi:hypothetical protein